MASKIEVYEEALEQIRDDETMSAEGLRAIALAALDQFKSDRESSHAALVSEIRDFMIANRLLFANASDLADALNGAGKTTIRGKSWTKSTVSRYLADVRDMLQQTLAPSSVAIATEGAQAEVQQVTTGIGTIILTGPIEAGTITASNLVSNAVASEVIAQQPFVDVVATIHAESVESELDALLNDLNGV